MQQMNDLDFVHSFWFFFVDVRGGWSAINLKTKHWIKWTNKANRIFLWNDSSLFSRPHQNSLLCIKIWAFNIFCMDDSILSANDSYWKFGKCHVTIMRTLQLLLNECRWELSSNDGLYWNWIYFKCSIWYNSAFHFRIYYRAINFLFW